jgi:hypothetical protein
MSRGICSTAERAAHALARYRIGSALQGNNSRKNQFAGLVSMGLLTRYASQAKVGYIPRNINRVSLYCRVRPKKMISTQAKSEKTATPLAAAAAFPPAGVA